MQSRDKRVTLKVFRVFKDYKVIKEHLVFRDKQVTHKV